MRELTRSSQPLLKLASFVALCWVRTRRLVRCLDTHSALIWPSRRLGQTRRARSLCRAHSLSIVLWTSDLLVRGFHSVVVILVTLVFQGLTLPVIVQFLKIEDVDGQVSEEKQLSEIRCRMAKLSVDYLDDNYTAELQRNNKLNRYYEQLLHVIGREQRINGDDGEAEEHKEARTLFNAIFLELMSARRAELKSLRREKTYDDEVLREFEHTLDLEEARMRV